MNPKTLDAFMRGLGGGKADSATANTPSGYPAPVAPPEPAAPPASIFGGKYFTAPLVVTEGNQSRLNLGEYLRTGYRNMFGAGGGGQAVAAPVPTAPQMIPAHTPGAVLSTLKAPALPATPGARRVSARSVATGAPAALTPNPDEEGLRTPEAPRPMTTENTDAEGVVPASLMSQVQIAGNGGFGFTRNDDGTVGQMFTLRSRTPEEDAAYAQPTAPQNQGITTDRFGRPYDAVDTSPGSHAAWVEDQAMEKLRDMGLGYAKLALERNSQAETARNNLSNNQSSLINALSLAKHYGTLDTTATAKLPWEIGEIGSKIKTEEVGRGLTAAKTAGQLLENQFYPQVVQAGVSEKNASAYSHYAQGDKFKAETPKPGKVKDTVMAAIQGEYDKAVKTFIESIAASPSAAMQYKTHGGLLAAAHAYATPVARRYAASLDAAGVQ